MLGMTKTSMSFSFLSTLVLVALAIRPAKSVNMTVQATINPKPSIFQPLCSVTSLLTLQPLLTLWVTQATLPYITDFTMPQGGLVLTYYNPVSWRRQRRMLRLKEEEEHATKLDPSRSLTTKIAPGSCSSCTSSGCSTYCGSATCSLCSDSRRRLAAEELFDSATDRNHVNDERRRLYIDYADLGSIVSASVQSSLQSYLLSSLGGLLGCLGNPLYLTTNVTFMVNQNFLL